MATHSSILAWRIPWREEPDGLQSMRSQRVGYDGATNTFTAHHKKKKKKTNNNPIVKNQIHGQNVIMWY